MQLVKTENKEKMEHLYVLEVLHDLTQQHASSVKQIYRVPEAKMEDQVNEDYQGHKEHQVMEVPLETKEEMSVNYKYMFICITFKLLLLEFILYFNVFCD